MKNNIKLQQYRRQVDKIDKKIIEYLAKRYQVVEKIGIFKKQNNLPTMDKKRWLEVLNSRIQYGLKLNLSEQLIKKIYKIIHQFSLKFEKKIKAEK